VTGRDGVQRSTCLQYSHAIKTRVVTHSKPQLTLCTSSKSKVFPEWECVASLPVDGMSCTWRSVLKGIELLKKGIRWQIGDGRSVRIWNDPWIPRGTTRRLCSHQGRHLLQWVNELIEPATSQWDTELVTQTFHLDDVKIILTIPLVPDI
jgi:hypothetical protein